MTLGPFEITADRVEALGIRFSPFINRLLELERRSQGIAGYQLTVTVEENTPDGGVDAATRGARASDWLPAGDTAWQFKRSRLSPQQCADELEGAIWAHSFLRDGGSYVLVIGHAMPDQAIEERRRRVAEKTIELGLLAADNRLRIRVYDANALARWASRYPSLAVSRLAGGPGFVAIDYEDWSHKAEYQTVWTADPSRDNALAALRDRLRTKGLVEIRVQGDPGLGKTRLVLEALGDEDLRALVAYVDDVQSVSGELIEHLIGDDRTAILVVDECPADRHIKLVQKLPTDPAIKLITIGPNGPATTRSPIVTFDPMAPDKVEEFLQSNYRNLSPEARRFVALHCQGNTRWAIVLAERVGRMDAAQAADLIARNDIQQFVTTVLPEGRDFFCSAALALLERVGWDGELRPELEILAGFAGVDVGYMIGVGRDLVQRGLLTKQGRYRAISPHPLAVFLAAEAWRSESSRIMDELLPKLNDEMALALFQRVADLGRFEPARSVLPRLLAHDGPFGSLEQIEKHGLGRLLTQLAIVLPNELTLHLGELIEAASVDTLRTQVESRRDLVWTLEKLAWHSETFDRAADALLKLALAENETFANNATGTWLSLFGTMLPATGASPSQRSQHLSRVAADAQPNVRLLAVRAAGQTLTPMEAVTVSAELQGGVLVEPRGSASTWAEVKDYHSSSIRLLESLLKDEDGSVAAAAVETLVGALHSTVEDPVTWEPLIEALARLQGLALQRLRVETEHLLNLYQRHRSENQATIERLQSLLHRLPAPTQLEQIDVLARLQPWDLEHDELQSRLRSAVNALSGTEQWSAALGILTEEMPAAWQLGHAFASAETRDKVDVVESLVGTFDKNPAALAGYLAGLVDAGANDAFDDFLNSEAAKGLDTRAKLFLAVRGPVTDRARARIFGGLHELPVGVGTFTLFGWQRNLGERDVVTLLDDWIERILSQDDYNALIDWANLWVHGKQSISDELKRPLRRLVIRRGEYPTLRQQQWDWNQLAKRFLDTNGLELAQIVLDSVESGAVMIHESDEDAKLIREAAQQHPNQLWADVGARLLRGSWRVQIEVGGWLLSAMPAQVVVGWVGEDAGRARLAASISLVGGEQPSDLTRHLLDKFGDDQAVASALSGQFLSGVWMGHESDRIAGQIEQLSKWRTRSDEPLGVRNWAKQMVEYLEQRRLAVLEREAEEGL